MSFSCTSIRKLICSECGKFLSVGPIKVTDTGSAVCGRCNEGAVQVHQDVSDLIQGIKFPCSNVIHGCTERVDWQNARQHEDACGYSKNEELTLDGHSSTIFKTPCCTRCNNVLNVSPIRQNEPNELLCGSCASPYVSGEERKPIRLRFFEEVVKTNAIFACRYANRGCEMLMYYDYVAEHEDNCAKRSVQCPLIPNEGCVWPDGRMELVGKHLQQKHPESLLKHAQIEFDPSEDAEIRKTFELNKECFLTVLKVDTSNDSVMVCVRYLGDSRLAVNYQFRSTLSAFVKDKKKSIPLDIKNVGDVRLLALTESCTVDVNLDGLVLVFRNAPCITCTVDVMANERYVKCSKEFCDRVIEMDSIVGHENECTFGGRKCRWPDCNVPVPEDTIETHEESCDARCCSYSGCTAIVARSDVQEHQNACPQQWKNRYCCLINDCRQCIPMPDLIGHIKQRHNATADRIITGNAAKRTVAKGSDGIYLRCHYSLFRFSTYFVGDDMRCWCAYLGKPEDGGKYRAVLEFGGGGGGGGVGGGVDGATKLTRAIPTDWSGFSLGVENSAKCLRNGAIDVAVTITKIEAS